jgi:hypothetical protein
VQRLVSSALKICRNGSTAKTEMEKGATSAA